MKLLSGLQSYWVGLLQSALAVALFAGIMACDPAVTSIGSPSQNSDVSSDRIDEVCIGKVCCTMDEVTCVGDPDDEAMFCSCPPLDPTGEVRARCVVDEEFNHISCPLSTAANDAGAAGGSISADSAAANGDAGSGGYADAGAGASSMDASVAGADAGEGLADAESSCSSNNDEDESCPCSCSCDEEQEPNQDTPCESEKPEEPSPCQ